jgi:YegS/Rv2252/BmrU family lipid kinase
MKIAAVVNPHSAGGKTERRWPQLARAMEQRLGPVTAGFTKHHGDGINLTRNLLHQGFDLIVAVGGDGTINEVMNGFLQNDTLVRPEASLGIMPTGTGGDFRRALGLPSRNGSSQAIDRLACGFVSRLDVGKARFLGHDGSYQERYFINLASFGIGGLVAARSRNFLTPLGGRLAFLWATLRGFLDYRGSHVTLTLDGGRVSSHHKVTDVCVGNGGFYGGGMHPCPKAVLDDGIFEVTVIDYMNVFTLFLGGGIRGLYSDNIYRNPRAHHLRAAKIKAKSDNPAWVGIDGEPLGRLPLEITLLPRLLPVVVGPSMAL